MLINCYTCFRGERLKLHNDVHQMEKKHRLMSMHLLSERSSNQEQLKDLVAHRHVLATIANNNAKQYYHNDMFGRYGEGAHKVALLPEIEEEKTHMEPVQRRKAKCVQLLQQRRKMTVMQRTLSTPQVLRYWTKPKKQDGEAKEDDAMPRFQARLTVPPIQAHPQIHRPKATARASPLPSVQHEHDEIKEEDISVKHILQCNSQHHKRVSSSADENGRISPMSVGLQSKSMANVFITDRASTKM